METLLNDALIIRALDSFGKTGVASIVTAIETLPVTKFGPVNASGNLARSIRYALDIQRDSASLTFYAAEYALTAVFGRRPGKFPPVQRILQWIGDKPVKVELSRRKDGSARQVRLSQTATRDRTLLDEKKTAAFLISRAIAQKGTLLHQASKPSQLLEGITGEQAIRQLTSSVLPGLVQQLTSVLQQAK